MRTNGELQHHDIVQQWSTVKKRWLDLGHVIVSADNTPDTLSPERVKKLVSTGNYRVIRIVLDNE